MNAGNGCNGKVKIVTFMFARSAQPNQWGVVVSHKLRIHPPDTIGKVWPYEYFC